MTQTPRTTGDGDPAAPPSAASAEFTARVTKAYATEGGALALGRAVFADEVLADAIVQIPIAMMNRHGLIAGATGTGKTVTVQLLAEQLAAAGVAVFAADMKGDMSGLLQPGVHNERIDERIAALGIDWEPAGRQVEFWSLGGLGEGIPLRASVSSFGPQLLAKVLGVERHAALVARARVRVRRAATSSLSWTSPTCAPSSCS